MRLKILLLALLFPLNAWAADPFVIASTEIADGQSAPDWMVYDGYGCTGDNRSPYLAWSGAPDGTKSFALTMADPDAPHKGGWWHWLVLDIPATASSLAPHAGHEDDSGLPIGARSLKNSYGKFGYGGPCPPKGSAPHHYQITLYALPFAKALPPSDLTLEGVNDWLSEQALAKTKIVITYAR